MLLVGLGILVCSVFVSSVVIAEEKTSEKIVIQSIDKVFKPASLTVEKRTRELQQAVTEDCQSDVTKMAFKQTVEVFSEMEFYRLGVINQNNRLERLFFWPDRKATGQKQMRRLLKDPNRHLLNAEKLSHKSVALQGLPALERILYGVVSDEGAKDCVVAQAIASNMNNIAKQIQTDWQAGDGVTAQLLNGGQKSLYRNSAEAMTAILTLSQNATTVLSEKKLATIINGLQQSAAIPKSAPFWRSGMTLKHLAGNLLSVEQLLVGTGIAQAADAASTLKFEFRTANNMLQAATVALDSNDTETASNRLLAVQLIVDSISTTIAETLAPRLGVVTGFNSSDGD